MTVMGRGSFEKYRNNYNTLLIVLFNQLSDVLLSKINWRVYLNIFASITDVTTFDSTVVVYQLLTCFMIFNCLLDNTICYIC